MTGSPEADAAHHLRLLVDQVPSMLAYWDSDLRCRFANRAYERWFGVKPEALLGRPIQELLGPTLYQLNEPYIRAALRGEAQSFEREIRAPDGTLRYSLATYIPDIDDGGVVKGFVAHVSEVTQLKLTEDALRREIEQSRIACAQLAQAHAALHEAQRLGQIGSWEWDLRSNQLTWTDELFRIFGRSREGPAPTVDELSTLYTRESWSRLQAAISEAISAGTPYALELEFRRADGATAWIEGRGEAVRDAQGQVVKLRGTALDITLRREVDDARVRLRVAEAANRSKSTLLSRLSHELRTPLNGILGFAQLLQNDEGLAPRHREWADVITRSGLDMLKLVDELLDLSAAEMGQVTIHRADVDLTALVRECVEAGAALAEATGVRVEGPRPNLPLHIQTDRRRLKQVICNLVSNAVKYTPTGGRVEIASSDLGDRVELRVRDTGTGLTPDQIERLFVPFERLGAERKGIAGTGLGLPLSRALVELMGGRLEVSSQPGQGSTFTLMLPRASA